MSDIGTSPVAFERNANGHLIVPVTGVVLTGAQEIERLETAGYRVGTYAKSCFMSTAKDAYDKNHLLVAGQSYNLAIVPGTEIQQTSDRTTAKLRDLGMKKYGYGEPLAGFIPRVRETVSDEQMKEWGIWYIAALHAPIKDSGRRPDVLDSSRNDGGLWVYADWDSPGRQWRGDGAFAFPVPAS